MSKSRPRKEINKLMIKKEEYNSLKLQTATAGKELVNDIFAFYINPNAQKELLEELEKTKYSQKKTKQIEEVFASYNTDVVNMNVVNLLLEAEKHIRDTKDEGFFSAIANVFIP